LRRWLRREAPALIASGVLIGVALSCTASSLALTATARAIPEQRRSKVLGIVSAAGSLGTLLTPLMTQALLAHQARQVGALFFVALAIMMLPAGFCAGGADRLPGAGAPRATMREMIGQATRHRPFLVMSGAYFVCSLNLVFLTSHLPTYLAICGQDPMLSAEALAVIGGMNCVGALVFTAYFVMPPTPASTVVFAAAMGMLWLSVAPLVSGLVAEMFGTRYMATLLGLAFVMHRIGSSLGAWGGGLIGLWRRRCPDPRRRAAAPASTSHRAQPRSDLEAPPRQSVRQGNHQALTSTRRNTDFRRGTHRLADLAPGPRD
jgi:hypothetical protein